MRLLVTGVDQTGRSCAAQDGPIELHGDASIDGMLYSMLYASPSVPPMDDGGRAAGKLDLVLPPGALRWTTIEYAPGAEFSMHHTDTVDSTSCCRVRWTSSLMTAITCSSPVTAR